MSRALNFPIFKFQDCHLLSLHSIPFMNIGLWLMFPNIRHPMDLNLRGCPRQGRLHHFDRATIPPHPVQVRWTELMRTVFVLWTLTKCWPMGFQIKKYYWLGSPTFILRTITTCLPQLGKACFSYFNLYLKIYKFPSRESRSMLTATKILV